MRTGEKDLRSGRTSRKLVRISLAIANPNFLPISDSTTCGCQKLWNNRLLWLGNTAFTAFAITTTGSMEGEYSSDPWSKCFTAADRTFLSAYAGPTRTGRATGTDLLKNC